MATSQGRRMQYSGSTTGRNVYVNGNAVRQAEPDYVQVHSRRVLQIIPITEHAI